MKIALVFAATLALAFGRVAKDRFDPCIFIDCTKFTTTKTPIEVTTPTKAPKEDLGKIHKKLVCYIRCFDLFSGQFKSWILFQNEIDAKLTEFANKDTALENKDKELNSNIVNHFQL